MDCLQKMRWPALLLLLVCNATCVRRTDTHSPAEGISWSESVVAGSPLDFMEARHIVLRGSNYAIGHKLAEMAQTLQARPQPGADPLRNRAQREYMKQFYPVLYERMRGLAAGFGIDLNNDDYDFSALSQFPTGPPGCSVVFYPGIHTDNGHSILSRNYDFTTGTLKGKRPQEHEMAVMYRPYLFEIYPDQGYASLSLCVFDLLGGVLDGINSEGLAVAILADDATIVTHGLEPANGVGLHELLSMRYVLDTCRDIDEAKQALLMAKHYYSFIPCHYLIADRSGRSTVFEFSPVRNSTHCIDGHGPQWVTNHLLSSYPTVDLFPEESMIDSFQRYRMLQHSIQEKSRFSLAEIKAVNASVAAADVGSGSPEYAPHRTLWHSLYDLQDRRLEVKFYLGEGENGVRYSEDLSFQLEAGP